MRIVFFGTSDFAVPSLKRLILGNYGVVAVVTAPDRPSGRGLKVTPSPVKRCASEYNLPVLQPANLKDPAFLAELAAFKPDLQVIIAFRMLPRQVWSLPPLGSFNLHASLLPQYRGAAPIHRAVMNGETVTGLTTFFLNDQIDTGRIILSEKVEIGPFENTGELHDRLMIRGAALVEATILLITSGCYHETEQEQLMSPGLKLKTAPKLFREECRIDWTHTVQGVFNFIRGLSPHPGAYTFIGNDTVRPLQIKVLKALPEPGITGMPPGTIFRNGSHQLLAACSDGVLAILLLQPEGKKVMSDLEFLRGYRQLVPEI